MLRSREPGRFRIPAALGKRRRSTLILRSAIGFHRTKEFVLKAIATQYHRAHHAFAVFTACFTFLVIMAGASVTSNDAGLSVPDWPTSFGYLVKAPHLVGGVRFEWSHRMVAGSLVVLTVAIAAWTLLVERRSWLRKLGLAALGTVIAQAIL